MKKRVIEKELQHIVNILLLNGTLTACPGLIHGKMGIAIFFFHYARYTENSLFEDYALDLIGEIQEQVHANNPADYERGIAGIGVGIDYIIRSNFLEADDDIFDDFDQRMYRAVMYDPCSDFSLYDGITGYGRYWLMRLYQQSLSVQARECLLRITELIKEKLPYITEKEMVDVYCFLHYIQKISGFDICIEILEQYRKQSAAVSCSFSCLGNFAISNIIRTYQHNYYFGCDLQDKIDTALKQLPDLEMEKQPSGMGLLNGFAGEGMLRLGVLHQTNMSWTLLL